MAPLCHGSRIRMFRVTSPQRTPASDLRNRSSVLEPFSMRVPEPPDVLVLPAEAGVHGVGSSSQSPVLVPAPPDHRALQPQPNPRGLRGGPARQSEPSCPTGHGPACQDSGHGQCGP
ncbi:uncharacterized protein LOC119433586 [Dermacentor silvarum]|uniref:uncharacterized protein LOC119433586 n=1 Tax=Dermacentor silvarum TaxID=543639 RepID=UPI002100F893|nr:uncharacterized protein LOC119433586 [Dermacentor silvarum]